MTKPMTGLTYWPFVYPLKEQLKARVPLAATLMELDTDALVVSIGSGTPYRLLVIYSDNDGLIRIKVWEIKRQLKEIVNEVCMIDLVPNVLAKVAESIK